MKPSNHIKNPLTVIAIFAGFAELGGTIVLPILDQETQSVYVWFLILFPILLVSLFFVLLWFKPTHLYAPSDFTDESNFNAALGTSITEKRLRETVEAIEPPVIPTNAGQISPEAGDEVVNVDPQIMDANEDADGSASEPLEPQLSRPSPSISSTVRRSRPRIKTSLPMQWEVLKEVSAVEQLAINAVSASTGLAFERNVSPQGTPLIVFDAVHESEHGVTVVEVKYSKNGGLPSDVYSRTFQDALTFWGQLPRAKQNRFLLIFVVVFAEGVSEVNKDLFRKSIESRIVTLPFTFNLRTYDIETLKAFVELPN